jgi:hypothetical protein
MDPLSWRHWICAAKLGPAPQKARTRYPSSLLAASHSTGNNEEPKKQTYGKAEIKPP